MNALPGSLDGNVWRIWGDFWMSKNQSIPPLHFLREGVAGDVIFVCAVEEKDLQDFISSQKTNRYVSFDPMGSWVIQPSRWFGRWTVFGAMPRAGVST